MKRRVKKKDHENLSASNIQKVIDLLNPQGTDTKPSATSSTQAKPITKKEACEILNISYNTTRLARIIEEHIEQQEYSKKRKADLRGKPLTNAELSEIATDYLQGDSIAAIAKSIFRPAALVHSAIEKVGIPTRPANKAQRVHTELLPTSCVAEDFKPGEIVWSAVHHRAAVIKDELSVNYQAEKGGFSDVNYKAKYGSKCYCIWVLENIDQDKEFWISGIETGGYNAYSLAYDLGKLEHLKEYGVDLSRI